MLSVHHALTETSEIRESVASNLTSLKSFKEKSALNLLKANMLQVKKQRLVLVQKNLKNIACKYGYEPIQVVNKKLSKYKFKSSLDYLTEITKQFEKDV